MMENIAILSAVRTPIGKGVKGVFKNTRPDELGSAVLKEALKRANISPEDIEDVIFGCAMPEGEQGMNVARIISLRAGLPTSSSAATVNRYCASGLNAIADVAKSIAVGQIEIGIGGGVESMSMVPMGGNKPSANPYLIKHFPEAYMSMGLTAEEVAQKFNISREMQDEFSLESHNRAVNAMKKGLFKEEIIGINTENKCEKYELIEYDEGPRPDTTLKALLELKPAFKLSGSVTAGNSSQVSDGAAAVVLANKKSIGSQKIRGFFRGFATAGVDPDIMGTGPVPAIRKLLKKVALDIKDIGVWEINEAFAAQIVYCIKELGLDIQKVNPLGGSIALGHPLGCTGARQVATILHHMERQKIRYGVCSMCIGGGMGAAALIELP